MKNTNKPALDQDLISFAWIGGVQIDDLDDLENLVVFTKDGCYEITVLSGKRGEILVRGGSLFGGRVAVYLSGASLAGSLLKVRGIYVGLNMEFEYEGRYVLTGPVRRIGIAS